MMMMKRVLLAFLLVAVSTAFCPVSKQRESIATTSSSSSLHASLNRREVLITGLAGLVVGVPPVQAASQAIANRKGVSTNANTWFFDENIENVREESQMPTGDKLDLNSAIVTEYQQFRGMYPHAAGMIASHGPYNAVKDIYKIQGITEDDKKLFKKYENEFTVNPPGRMFDERINQRQST